MNIADRAQRLVKLFPEGVPELWCPALTHFGGDGDIDTTRIAAHLRHLSPHVKGFLIPGSTGEGWEMNDEEMTHVVDFALDQARRLGLHLLIGVLKNNAQEALQRIRATVDRVKSLTGESDVERALAAARVRGFTVCPPRGAELSQSEIGGALSSILQTGLPVALYQLPQVTQNEISADLMSSLAREFPNLILFKDSSGADKVVLSQKSLGNVFTMRGAEGDYARWFSPTGGRYHGFLLSTANCFARELRQMMDDLSAGRSDSARRISDQPTAAVSEAFRLVAPVREGNAFTNANKALDHFFAHGPRAAEVPPPRLHAGSRLPVEVIRGAGEILSRHGLMPVSGYLG